MEIPTVIILIRAARIRGKIQIMSEENTKNMSGNFVICDIQTEYAECLFRVLSEQFHTGYQFHLFHDIEKMEEFIENAGADILLVSQEYEGRTEKFPGIGKRFVLTELPKIKKPDEKRIPVFRYQSADNIIKEIRAGMENPGRHHKVRDGPSRPGTPTLGRSAVSLTEEIRERPAYRAGTARGLLGIYSPVHRIGKTRYALRMGQKMAEKMPVLYLNLEGYSGGEFYFEEPEGQDLGDLLYCLKQERTDYGMRISSMASQIAGMDYIKPMKNELDLRAVSGKEWMRLLDLISEKCIYDAVILDLGDGIDGLYDILSRCDRVYTPYISDAAALAKVKQL